LRPQEQRYWRLGGRAQRRGWTTALQEFRWLLEELRVSFFAQELRTPQPVSVKRLEQGVGAADVKWARFLSVC
jgi:ATP-dependent helicase HrpA